MATKLEAGGEVVREISTDLLEDPFRSGCAVKITPEGVFLKAPNKRWTNSRFLAWPEVLRYAEMPKKDALASEATATEPAST